MATNRLDSLDPALLRPGRIDRKIFFPEPSLEARADILKIHSRKMNLTKDVDLKKIAEKMPVTSGAEVKAVCTEAGMFALRERRTHVNMEDFELAVAKVQNSTLYFICLRSRSLLDWITKRRAYRNYGSNKSYGNEEVMEITEIMEVIAYSEFRRMDLDIIIHPQYICLLQNYLNIHPTLIV
jgi:SpoVK/Ycf46/Vps4 family AAA+-type ATPase